MSKVLGFKADKVAVAACGFFVEPYELIPVVSLAWLEDWNKQYYKRYVKGVKNHSIRMSLTILLKDLLTAAKQEAKK